MAGPFISPKEPEAKKLEDKEVKKDQEKYSSWSVFLGILLAVVLTAIWERAFYDLSRLFNPVYTECQNTGFNAVSGICDMKLYEVNRIFLHLALIVPLLVILLIAALIIPRKKTRSHAKIILRAYFFSVVIIVIHGYIEFAVFLFRYYREIGNYVVLFTIALAFIFFIIYIQRRLNNFKKVIKEEKTYDDSD